MEKTLEQIPAAAAVHAGVARGDITPPVGIYSRMWGAAKHDVSEGVHRPLTVTVLALREQASTTPMFLVALDWVITRDAEVLEMFRRPLEALCGGDAARVIISHTHTHGIGFLSLSRRDLPGGDRIEPYMNQVGEALAAAGEAALAGVCSCTLTWATGRCNLAAERDLRDPAPGADRFLCGFNPEGEADDTLLVGRISRDSDGGPLATLVNYACHPTTLAWENKLSSPDFVGAMREVIEEKTAGSPCLFLQGASGELAPRYQYTGDHALADRYGRQLGYAALSTLESMLGPRQKLVYEGPVESGAPLAVWRPQPFEPPSVFKAQNCSADLPLKSLPALDELQAQHDACTDRTLAERLHRKMGLVEQLSEYGDSTTYPQRISIWQIGQLLVVALAGEPYSVFQIALRRFFPDYAVVVMGVANSGLGGYFPPPDKYDLDLYQVWQTPFDRQALPVLIDTCRQQIQQLLD
jgi:hypothetical protein